jgi:hypothetical protein
MKLRAVFRHAFAAPRHGTVVTLAIVETMIDVSIKISWPVKPGSSPEEDTA